VGKICSNKKGRRRQLKRLQIENPVYLAWLLNKIELIYEGGKR